MNQKKETIKVFANLEFHVLREDQMLPWGSRSYLALNGTKIAQLKFMPNLMSAFIVARGNALLGVETPPQWKALVTNSTQRHLENLKAEGKIDSYVQPEELLEIAEMLGNGQLSEEE